MSIKDIDIYKQRLAIDPLDRNAFLALRNIYMRNGQYVELAQLFEMRSSYLGNNPEAADLLFRAGEIWINQIGDIVRGTTDFLQTLEIAPNHRSAAERLEKIYKDAGDYQSLLHVLTKFVEGLETYEPGKESAKTRSSIYQQIGEIWETYYQRADNAISFYKKAAQVDPTNVMAIYMARNIYCNVGDYETAARLYDLEVNAEPDPERKKALLRELALLKEKNLGDLEGSIVTLRRALVLGPSDPEILYELGTALIRKNEKEELTRDEFELAADCFFKLSQLSDPEVSLRYLEAALDLMPSHQGALEMYENSCMAEGRWQDLKIRLQRSMDSITDRRQRIPILRKLGKLCFEKLNQPVEALAYFETLEEYGDPTDLDMLAKIRVTVGAGKKHEKPGEVFEEEETLDQLMSTSKQILEEEKISKAPSPLPPSQHAPPKPPASEQLSVSPVAEMGEKVQPQERVAVPILKESQEAAIPPKLPDVSMEQISRLKSDAEKLAKLSMLEKAEEKMRQVLKLVPDDAQAWAFLEKRLRAAGKFAELRDLLLEASDWPSLSDEFKLQKLREAAALSETRLRDADSSIRVYKKMIQLDPSNKEVRKNLEKILVANKKWDEYVAFLDESVYGIEERQEKVEIYKKISEIHLLRRDDPKSAFESLWAALEISPDDKEIIGRLDELALRMRNWVELEKILKIQLDHEEDPGQRRRIYDRLISLQDETIEDVEGAYDTCRKMLEEFPDDLEILRRLSRIQEVSERYSELIETLQKISELTSDPKEKAASYKKLAKILWDQFDDAEKSASYWEKFFEIIQDDLEAYEMYGQLLEGLGRYEDLIVMYKNLLKQEKLKNHHRFFLKKLGLLLSSDEIGRREEAMSVWKKLLEGGDDVEALRTLAVWHREKGEWNELVENLQRQLKIAQNNADKVVIYKDMSEILNVELGKKKEAIESLKIALNLDPEDEEALSMLRAIYADMGNFKEAAEVLEKEISLMKDPTTLKEMLEVLALWYDEKIKDKVKAVSAYERLLQAGSTDRKVFDTLEILYEETKEWEKLLRLLRTKANNTNDEAEILDYMLKGANICEKTLRDNVKAWGWYKEIFGRISVDEDVMVTIEQAAERMGQWEDLVSMYEELASREDDIEQKVRRWRQAARVASTKTGNNTRALNDIYQASLIDPDMVELVDDADLYAINCKDWERLAMVYDRISRNISDPDGRIALMRRFANLLWKKGNYPAGAVMPLLRASEEKPEDTSIFEEFNQAALEAKEYEILIDALDKRFKSTSNKDERIEIKLKMARIMAEYLKDVDGAIKIIREAVEVDPANERFGKLILEAAKSIEINQPPDKKGYIFSWLLKIYKQHADAYEASDPFRIVFLRQIAKIYLEGLEDPNSAFSILTEAHRLNPSSLEILGDIEQIASCYGYWEPFVDHLSDILRLSIKMDVAKVIHEKRAMILSDHLGRHEDAAEHYWQLIQCDPMHPYAFRKLADFYRTVGRFNDLLMLLESEVEKRQDRLQRAELLKEIALVWEVNMNNKFEAMDVYKRVLNEIPDDKDSLEAIDRLGKSKLGLSLRLQGKGEGEEEEKEEEKVDIDSLRQSLLEEELESEMKKDETAQQQKGMLPDWEDDMKTGELPVNKVVDILNKAEGLEEETDSALGSEEIEEIEDDIEPLPTDSEKIVAGRIQREEQAIQRGEDEKGVEGRTFVLDNESLKEVLQEEYEIPAAQQTKGEQEKKNALPSIASALEHGRKKSISTPPPPPPKKK